MTTFVRPSITDFHDHELQPLMAVFLSNPTLYKDYKTQRDKQGYFFDKFRKFAANYYHFDRSPDASCYFMSMRKECAGEFNACGGAGKISNAAAREFKARHKSAESSREERIDTFSKKYRVVFNQPGKEDPRLFLGVSEIWNKLDNAAEIVTNSKWSAAPSMAYSDETFVAPIPANLDKSLVPFSIRNRAVQKHRNLRIKISVAAHIATEEEEEEDAETQEKVSAFIRPQECDDDDW